MRTPQFPEANHPLIKSLFPHSDQDLLDFFQQNPGQGKYFITLFCRYSKIVHKLIWHSNRSAVKADYLFALTWQYIFEQMRTLNLEQEQQKGIYSFQGWVIKATAFCLTNSNLPPVESINYNLKAASPPLWCYVKSALDQLPPSTRLMVIMADNFHWNPTRIAAYLEAEGESMSPAAVEVSLQEGYQLLENSLPEDVRSVYFNYTVNHQIATAV